MRLAAFLIPIVALTACLPEDGPELIIVEGETMGTTYSVTVFDPPEGATEEGILDRIETVLADVNGKMSNWDPNSEISLFNKSTSVDPIEISPDMAFVMDAANEIHGLSGGKFDVTVAPLIQLWGFGPARPGDPVPSESEIFAALGQVGQSTHLTLHGQTLKKAFPGVSVNLSAIAKGYGIDRIATALKEDGFENTLVEIGGDLATRGSAPGNREWTIGIELPGANAKTISARVRVPENGMATSGDYRNYFEEDGVRYSHIIDPTTGSPVVHTTASVTVIAEDAMMADGLATALLAIGGHAAHQVAVSNNIAAFFINRKGDTFESTYTSAFEPYLTDR